MQDLRSNPHPAALAGRVLNTGPLGKSQPLSSLYNFVLPRIMISDVNVFPEPLRVRGWSRQLSGLGSRAPSCVIFVKCLWPCIFYDSRAVFLSPIFPWPFSFLCFYCSCPTQFGFHFQWFFLVWGRVLQGRVFWWFWEFLRHILHQPLQTVPRTPCTYFQFPSQIGWLHFPLRSCGRYRSSPVYRHIRCPVASLCFLSHRYWHPVGPGAVCSCNILSELFSNRPFSVGLMLA